MSTSPLPLGMTASHFHPEHGHPFTKVNLIGIGVRSGPLGVCLSYSLTATYLGLLVHSPYVASSLEPPVYASKIPARGKRGQTYVTGPHCTMGQIPEGFLLSCPPSTFVGTRHHRIVSMIGQVLRPQNLPSVICKGRSNQREERTPLQALFIGPSSE